MSTPESHRHTVPVSAHLDADGVVAYRINGGPSVHDIYCVAQQARLGSWFVERCIEGRISIPYIEFIEPEVAIRREPDAVARTAADWLLRHARPDSSGAIHWPHDFDFVPSDGAAPLRAGWSSNLGQSNALLACLHFWKHTGEVIWRKTALGAARSLSADWFDTINGRTDSRALAPHLLALFALRHAADILDDSRTLDAFRTGWRTLLYAISRYDLLDWSRPELSDRFFLLLRLVPSTTGLVLLQSATLETAGGRRLAMVDAAHSEPSDDPVTRLAGIDWGGIESVYEFAGRRMPNRQAHHRANIPAGGTDQNTYLIFEEVMPPALWLESGLRLVLDARLSPDTSLAVEVRDLRDENLIFRANGETLVMHHDGHGRYHVDVPTVHVGLPTPRHIHRFHVETLGALMALEPDKDLQEVFERWHRADLYDIPLDMRPDDAPKTIFAFVNDRCGLKCKMCDIGLENLGVDQEHLQSVQDAYAHGGTLTVLKPALSLNMTDKARDADPDMFLAAIRRLGSSTRGALLQLNGTEPLLYPHYPDILSLAKTVGLHTGITTSGLFLNKEADRLAEIELDELLLSIDGPPIIHDEVRGVPGLFSRISDGLAKLRAACAARHKPEPTVVVSFAVTLDNHRHVLAFLDAVRPMRPQSVIINHLNFVAPEVAIQHTRRFPQYPIGPSSVPAWEDCLRMDFLELFRQIEFALRADWTSVSVIPYCPTPTRLHWYYSKPALPMSRSRCAAPWASVQIRADGSVGVLARCFDISLGDLHTQSIEQVWAAKPKSDFTEFIVQEPYLGPCMRCCGSL